jgi:hypothetical protein
MKIKKKIKNLKPTEINLHLKYKCPECQIEHWISLDEAKTTGYMIVCDCKTKLKVKPIKTIRILYKTNKTTKAKPEKIDQSMPVVLLENCVKILVSYGFSAKESKTLVEESYKKNSVNDALIIIKDILANIGGTNG